MYKTILISLLSTIFIGCSSTNALKYFKSEQNEARAIQYTKKTDISKNNEAKVLFWGTYLNIFDKTYEDTNEETFVVTVFFTDKSTQNLEENGYFLTLNNNKPIKAILIDKNDEKYKAYTTKNKWANHYLVSFPEQKDTYDLKLKLQSYKSSSVQLDFEK